MDYTWYCENVVKRTHTQTQIYGTCIAVSRNTDIELWLSFKRTWLAVGIRMS